MESISNSLIHRLAYSRDASIYRIIPDGVIWPKNESEIIELFSHVTQNHSSVTFRTGGTSLSGQSVGEGLIADVSKYWQKSRILDNGNSIFLEPGVVGSRANLMLKPSCMKIGPDPASINSAMIGGIVNNNSSGMACGTDYNAYHTLKSIRFILANGHIYDTSQKSSYLLFKENEPSLCQGILELRHKIIKQPHLVDKIRNKYRIKNTMGYSVNAFLDYSDPLDIFAHLLVGSEGTLGFMSNVTLKTIPDPPEKSTGLFIFEKTLDACSIVPHLGELGVSSLEYMDYSSLLTAKYLHQQPFELNKIPLQSAGLLVEFQDNDAGQLHDKTLHISQFIQDVNGYLSGTFTEDEALRELYWNLRKGLYPTVGALRQAGTSVITEDIAVDPDQIGQAVNGLIEIFERTHTKDAVIFGHAKDGNLHFVASVNLEEQKSKDQYKQMIDEMADMTLGKFNGSLKAEHGTGRNMAPFVETEWGGDIYGIMKEIKMLADPNNILNPGVLINSDKSVHINNLKDIPKVNNEIDLCVECGFCEKVCPSNGLTLTPRQRIILAREKPHLSTSEIKSIEKELNYAMMDTCATDGLCELECPVNINTGAYIKELRHITASDSNEEKSWIVNHFSFVLSFIKFLLRMVNLISVIAPNLLYNASKIFNILSKRKMPIWTKEITKTVTLEIKEADKSPDYILFTSCANRVISPDGKDQSLAEHLIHIGKKAGYALQLPTTINDLCCGMVFQSRGQTNRATLSLRNTVETLYQSSQSGSIPIIIDMSPCSYHIVSEGAHLTGELYKMWKSLTIMDSVTFLHQITTNFQISPLDKTVAIHPTCSNTKLSINDQLLAIAKVCATEVIMAEESHCCGMAGDRGLRFPELTEHATQYEKNALKIKGDFDVGYSSGRTCEIGMGISTGKPYFHIALLVEEAIKNKELP